MTLVARAGRFLRQPLGYRAFIPAPIPPEPPIRFDLALAVILSRADQTVGRLGGVISPLPEPDLVVAMYIRQERS
ncbi:MAG TPA: hypothetical protein VER37_11340 [Thermomicrobiales bacterium]|nr:hypothetical protein [Thermomicrobiales bacterium]